jgi:aminoglycoside phosphotransferase (APT) family kinase protein
VLFRSPEVERLIEWLPRTMPEQRRTAIVHGDYRIDNMIFAEDEPQIMAVLDWELSTLGDPMADFSHLMMNWETPPNGGAGVKGLTGPDSGIPTMEQLIDRYCAATGQPGVGNLNWYFAFSQFRLMSIAQGIRKRFLDGNASNARAEEAGAAVPMLAQRAWTFAQLAGAI